MLTQPSVLTSSWALLLASSHTWGGAMGVQRGSIQPPQPRDGSLVTAGLEDTRTGEGSQADPAVMPGCSGCRRGTFWDGVCQAPTSSLRLGSAPSGPPRRQFWGYLAVDLDCRPQFLQFVHGGGAAAAGDHHGDGQPQLPGRVGCCQPRVSPCGECGVRQGPTPCTSPDSSGASPRLGMELPEEQTKWRQPFLAA